MKGFINIVGLLILIIVSNSQNQQYEDFIQGKGDGEKLVADFNNMDRIKQLLKMNIPYESLLPRRRQAQPGLGALGAIFNPDILQKKSSSKDEENPLDFINKILTGRHSNSKTKAKAKSQSQKIKWDNPDYQDGQNKLSTYKIFGKKNKNRKIIQDINQSQIKALLIQQMPALTGGDILRLDSTQYNKGMLLNIQFCSKKQQIYMIKAKYSTKNNELQIISFAEKEISWGEVIDKDTLQSSLDIEEIVNKQEDGPKIRYVPKKQEAKQENIVVAKAKGLQQVQSLKEEPVKHQVLPQKIQPKTQSPLVKEAQVVKEQVLPQKIQPKIKSLLVKQAQVVKEQVLPQKIQPKIKSSQVNPTQKSKSKNLSKQSSKQIDE